MKIKFKRDTAFRKQFFVPDSFAHPAKMDAQLLIWIVERYTEKGEIILDPMAGSGTTMLACGLGRHCILVELEGKFCKMMRDNWEEVRMRPQLGYQMGNCQIIQGDARQLEGLVDKIVTSPPYAETIQKLPDNYHIPITGSPQSKGTDEVKLARYSDNPNNIGNLPYGEIDKCIFSPPYEEAMGKKHHSPRADKLAVEKSNPTTYTGQIDKIVTSPPYEAQGQGQGKEYHPERMVGTETGLGRGYGDNVGNIGNLKSQSYLEAMLQVYQQCYKVLKPSGLMILVTKNFIRNKQIVRLDEDTIKLCEQAGFGFVERHNRKLPSQSFWRVIYHQKHPEVEQINHEDILVFQR